MIELGQHCPFLNRADARCSTHFQIEHLGEAFEHCFGGYQACAVYQDLLKERQARRAAAAESRLPGGPWHWAAGESSHETISIVPLTCSARASAVG